MAGLVCYLPQTAPGPVTAFMMTLFRDEERFFCESEISSRNRVGETVHKVCDFLSGKTTHEKEMDISQCIEELLLNYVEHSGRSENAYMDISLIRDRDGITLLVKDDGIPFDPVHAANEDTKAGLKIVKEFMNDASYSYSFGQNVVVMKWKETQYGVSNNAGEPGI